MRGCFVSDSELQTGFLLLVKSDQYTVYRIVCDDYEEVARVVREALEYGVLSVEITRR